MSNPQTEEQKKWHEAGRIMGLTVAYHRVNAMPDGTSLQAAKDNLKAYAGVKSEEPTASTVNNETSQASSPILDVDLERENRIGELLNTYARN
jgi:hypothetical protein